MPTQTPPIDDTDAKARFQQYEQRDPLPDVPAALLNSGDIYDYACITGMIGAFPDGEGQLKEKLKPASYEAAFLGEVHFTDDQGKYQEKKIDKGIKFVLEKNSIAYVFLETNFRLPDYIALRFNLKITHVHRGLLLGTGPLIDPGFCGRLLIPLHNLTSEDYDLKGGEGLIWVEFTKLSPHLSWDPRARQDSYDFVRFPENKRYRTAQQYLIKATGDVTPPKSSIPGEIRDAKDAATRAWKTILTISIAGILGAIALVYSSWDLGYSAHNKINSVSADLVQTRDRMDEKQKKAEESLREAQKSIGDLTEKLKEIEASMQTKSNQPIEKKRKTK